MPDTYPNPFQTTSPLGDALRNLSTAIMSGPTDAQRILQAEQALRAQTQRQGTEGVASAFQTYGTPQFDRNAVMGNAVRGGYAPENLAQMERYGSANTFGATDPRTTNAFVGAGGAFGSTPQGFRENQAREFAQFQGKPQVYGTDTGPVIGTVASAIGKPAVEPLSNVQGNAARVALNAPGGIAAQPQATQRFIGAEAKSAGTPHNYVLNGQNFITNDGKTDVNGQPLPPGGYLAPQGDVIAGLQGSTRAHLQQQDIALQGLQKVAQYSQQFITPQTTGVPGMVKSVAQNAASTVANLSQGLGYQGPQQWLADLKQRAIQSGANADTMTRLFTFDPNVPKLETAYHLLTLQAAEAMAGGLGKASDRDLRVIQHALGKPEELFATPESLRAKMQGVFDVIDIRRGTNQNNLHPGAPAPGVPAAPGAQAAAPPSAQAPGAPQQVETFTRDANGNIVRAQ